MHATKAPTDAARLLAAPSAGGITRARCKCLVPPLRPNLYLEPAPSHARFHADAQALTIHTTVGDIKVELACSEAPRNAEVSLMQSRFSIGGAASLQLPRAQLPAHHGTTGNAHQ